MHHTPLYITSPWESSMQTISSLIGQKVTDFGCHFSRYMMSASFLHKISCFRQWCDAWTTDNICCIFHLSGTDAGQSALLLCYVEQLGQYAHFETGTVKFGGLWGETNTVNLAAHNRCTCTLVSFYNSEKGAWPSLGKWPRPQGPVVWHHHSCSTDTWIVTVQLYFVNIMLPVVYCM